MDKPQKHYATCKKPAEKEHLLYDSIHWSTQKKQTCGDKKQIGDCLGLVVGRGIKRQQGSLWGDENVLKLHYDDGCTTQ